MCARWLRPAPARRSRPITEPLSPRSADRVDWAATGHPRPDLERRTWRSLNGPWEFAVGDDDYDRTIVVPFVHQSSRSGLADLTPWSTVRYRRLLPELASDSGRLLLHFGAVDFEADVVINGTTVGQHRGGHTSFTVDVTDHVRGAGDVLEVIVTDAYRPDQPRGKQTATIPYLVHYTASTGIWQSVWLERAGPAPVTSLQVLADADGVLSVDVEVAGAGADVLSVTVLASGEPVLDLRGAGAGRLHVDGRLADVRRWSPDDPHLYELVVEPLDAAGAALDEVHSWIGFRTVEVRAGRWFLNGQRFEQRLVLDQGYWPDTLLTPPSDEAICTDLEFVRAAGFDGVRKHQKVEDPRWLWWADRLGVVVWEEMPSPLNTAIVDGSLKDLMLAEWSEAVVRDRNHPCVVCWVPFNESWGIRDVANDAARQATVREFVARTRALDPTRPVCDNSGWAHVDGDVADVHDYTTDPARLVDAWDGARARGFARHGERPAPDPAAAALIDPTRLAELYGVHDLRELDPLVFGPPTDSLVAGVTMPDATMLLSEFGGIGLDLDAAAQGPDTFVYGLATDPEELLERFAALVAAAERVQDFDGWCWTQLTDVQQERNGLMTADRRPKVSPDDLHRVIR